MVEVFRVGMIRVLPDISSARTLKKTLFSYWWKVQKSWKVIWKKKLNDFLFSKVFYIDARRDVLSSMSYDGDNHQVVEREGIINHPFALSSFEDYVYFTDWQPGSIKRINKRNGSQASIYKNKLKKPMDIQVYHQIRQPKGEGYKNYCVNKTCSHLCVLKPKGFTCKCPFGMYMKANATNQCECKLYSCQILSNLSE